MKQIIVLGIIFLFFFLPARIIWADFQLNKGEVQLSVADILLDVEGSQSIIDEMAFYGSYFTVTLSASQQITITSADKRDLEVLPTKYSSWFKITCDSPNSKVAIQTPSSLIGSITFTITPKSTTCILGGGDGGSPGAVGAPSPPMTVLVPPEEKEEEELEVPPGEIPPPQVPLAVPGGILVPSPPAPPPTTPPPPTIIEEVGEAAQTVIEKTQQVAKKTVEAAQEIGRGLVEATKSIAKGDAETARGALENLRANPTVSGAINKVVTPFTAIVAVIGAAITALTAIQASAVVALQITTILQTLGMSRFYLLPLLRFKKRSPWGKVIEKMTNSPVQAALVQVYDAEFKKLKDTQLTDKEGRFGALVGPGKYFIRVSKNGFQDKETEVVEITSPNQVLNLEIPIALIQEAFGLEQLKKVNFIDVMKRFLENISPALLIVGTILSFISVIILPNLVNYIIFSVYVLLDVLKIYFAVHFIKPFGKVLNFASEAPLPLAIVRIFDEKKNLLLSTKASDDEGRFNFLLAPGRYYLTCVKGGYSPFRSSPLTLLKSGLATLDIKLQKYEGQSPQNH